VLHPDEVAADKTLALFGRAAARDLVDVAALYVAHPSDELVPPGDQVVHLTRLLHREPFQMVTAIQQPGHCLWRVRKPLSPQAPDE
jgi:hypothetical protein